MILASLLSSSKYIIVNKDLIKILGLHEAVIIGELCSEYTYWENTNQLNITKAFKNVKLDIKSASIFVKYKIFIYYFAKIRKIFLCYFAKNKYSYIFSIDDLQIYHKMINCGKFVKNRYVR